MTNQPGIRRPWWRALGLKLFASYLVVVAIGIATLLLAASLAAPSFFDVSVARMMNGAPHRQGAWASR